MKLWESGGAQSWSEIFLHSELRVWGAMDAETSSA
jgi:hypothetical protein